MRAFVVCACLVVTSTTNPGTILGQDSASTEADNRSWRFELFPRMGYHATDKSLGVASQNQLFGVSGSTTVGLSAEMTTPIEWFDLRVVYDRTLGADLVERIVVGDQPCGFNCRSTIKADLRTGFGATVETGALDAVVRPWGDGRVAPYAFAGVGFKRYALANEPTGPATARGYHFGLGLDLTLGPLELQVEAGNMTTGGWLSDFSYVSGDPVSLPLSQQALRKLRHDLVTSFGLKLRRWPFE